MKPKEVPPDLIEWVAKKCEQVSREAFPELYDCNPDVIQNEAALAIKSTEE